MYQYSNPETTETVIKLGVDDPEIISINSQEVVDWLEEGNTILPCKINQTWESVRLIRNKLLKETDIWAAQLSDWSYPMTEEQRAYRQALRDLPETIDDPSDVVWPTKPQ